ncbi:MAG: carbamoyltransferase HypF [Myxococcales bacterium]|nr:carbamoyltransferase HypF [Myxococcales bacterium]
MNAERIRIRGIVQGVGFRPTVARVANRMALGGFVLNDGDGVLVGVVGPQEARDRFLETLMAELPPLAEVDEVVRTPDDALEAAPPFRITESGAGEAHTDIPADAATCPDCAAEVMDPYQRRYRYPFATCTNCGPRYTIAVGVPFDRDTTTMARFPLCPECRGEYEDQGDRRFHAQAIACHVCGPKVRLVRADGRAFSLERYSMLDAVDAVGSLIRLGEVVAVKGLGSWHLCCDATNAAAVERLRARKRRMRKPFALMAKDLAMISRYAVVSEASQAALQSAVAPIVLLDALETPAEGARPLAEAVAPGQRTLGFMLPYTPLHHLMLRRVKVPIVCTSGNLTDEPPCIGDEEAEQDLARIADWLLYHDRPIQHRVDDSVVRPVAGAIRTVRRARGLAPHAERMPPGLEGAPPLFAAGAELKSAFALGRGAQVVLSPHLGDLEHLETFVAYEESHRLLASLYAHEPKVLVADLHPEYRATQWARGWAERERLPLIEVQHHHAHVAAVMAENRYPNDGAPVLGLALDGLGLGSDGQIWGGEALLCTYAHARRVGTFKPVAMIGGDLASRQPWRNLYAHLRAEASWGELDANFGDLPVIQALRAKPVAMLEQALAKGLGSPLASSAGRLFDAVAAAVGICFEAAEYEGQAAIELEAAITPADLEEALEGERYPVGIPNHPELDLPYIEPKGLWSAILGDVYAETRPGLISARFHVALAETLVRLVELVQKREEGLKTVALAGGVFQNAHLLTLTKEGLERAGLTTLTASRLPAHDGAIALGQAAVAAARLQR